jgi:hypothetical protein
MIFEIAKIAALIIVILAVFVPIAYNVMIDVAVPDQLWVFASAILSLLLGIGAGMLVRRK